MRIAWQRLAAAVALGVLLGVFSARGDGVGIMVVNGLANAASPWVLAAFTAGAIGGAPRWGAAVGALALLVGVWAYYVGFLLDGHAFLLPFMGVWSVAAVASGGLVGAAGGAWSTRRVRWRAAAAALVIGALVAEAAHRLIRLEIWTGIEWDRTYMQVGVANLVLAVLALVVLAETGRRLRVVAMAIPLAVVGLLVLLGVDEILRGVSGILTA